MNHFLEKNNFSIGFDAAKLNIFFFKKIVIYFFQIYNSKALFGVFMCIYRSETEHFFIKNYKLQKKFSKIERVITFSQ